MKDIPRPERRPDGVFVSIVGVCLAFACRWSCAIVASQVVVLVSIVLYDSELLRPQQHAVRRAISPSKIVVATSPL